MKRHCSAQAVECWIELCASFLLVFHRRVAWGKILKLPRFEKATPQQQSVLLLLLLLLPVNLISFRTRINAGDSFKWKSGVDNKRHTNAHQPLPDRSPAEVSIPPSLPPSLLRYKYGVLFQMVVRCKHKKCFLLSGHYCAETVPGGRGHLAATVRNLDSSIS